MLISTLISLTLLTGLTLTLQAQTLATTKLAKRLVSIQVDTLAQDAARELMRPIIGEAILKVDDNPPLALDGTDYTVEFANRTILVTSEVTKPKGFVSGRGVQPKQVHLTFLVSKFRQQ